MLVNVRNLAQQKTPQNITIKIAQRLPDYLIGEVELTCTYQAQNRDDFYLLQIGTEGVLNITCQRCLKPFTLAYSHQSILAICMDEEKAHELMESYEPIVAKNAMVNLSEILTDELHLNAPEHHAQEQDCDRDIDKYLDFIE